MDFSLRHFVFLSLFLIIPLLIKGLEVNEGELVTLTCPKPSPSLPVEWEGPPDLQHYSHGLTVSFDLSSDQRSRVSVSGDHANGYFNLQIDNIRKLDSGKYQCRIGSRIIRIIDVYVKTQAEQNQGLFPYILNLATRAIIHANATCGENKPEYFCKLVEHVDLQQVTHCDYCNARAGPGSSDQIGAAHPISNAIDGSNKWWQSPSINKGWEFNYVTITLDLGLVYQVAYVVVKAANSPRPGNWILEKSIDGIKYEPWQYFATTDEECAKIYKIKAVEGKPSYDYLLDDEVRCTSYFSKLNPLENGEIFVSLTNGRPGIFVASKALLDFTSARYVRLRLQKIRTLNADLMSLRARDPRNLDPSVTRRYFYSVKDISIGGQCICYGHASECQKQGDTDRLACVCQHNTCGTNCETCCPLFNQKPWQRGGGSGQTPKDVICEACNCHGHSDSCVYNSTVDQLNLSTNLNAERIGGGVCIDCKDFTTGINCEKCLPGHYRPHGVSQNSRSPCHPCNCLESTGSTGGCIEDDSQLEKGLIPGSCVCKKGYAGMNCDQCDIGYHSYPNCEPCSCSLSGTIDPKMCEMNCVCKANVDGDNCDVCKGGHYDLNVKNKLGCRQCFCFGIANVCQSAGLGLVQISDMRADMDGWTVITLNDDGFTYFPIVTSDWLEYRTYPAREQNFVDVDDRSAKDEVVYYWQAPVKYYGNRLTSYGGHLHYTVMFTLDESVPRQYHLAEADIILQGTNITITSGRNYFRENQQIKKSVLLEETEWYELDKTGTYISQNHVAKKDFMLLLYDLQRILIRATYHTAQDNVMLKEVILDTSSAGSSSNVTITAVEKCSCPRGYSGLSCESCDVGWRRADNVLYGGNCVPCQCHGHSKSCDPYTGKCMMCTDNTEGDRCEVCREGFYGDPSHNTPQDCKPCACPLTLPSNNFATTCVLSPTFIDADAFICLDCASGYTGERCHRCEPGYYGLPGIAGGLCQQCNCNGNIDRSIVGSCDQLNGECTLCLNNTEGSDCGRCRLGYYGTAVNGDCKLCNCDSLGSTDMTCNQVTGQCTCKSHFSGHHCDRCQDGHWGHKSSQGCIPCDCDQQGSFFSHCDSLTGQCHCKNGVIGQKCQHCADGYYGLVSRGQCQECKPCRMPGHICHPETGDCGCPPNTMGDRCEQCTDAFWGYDSKLGCKPCRCNRDGSMDDSCDLLTGQCACKLDYNGTNCDSCLFGFYGFPTCNLCLCSVAGTEPETCDTQGSCSCGELNGQCNCKLNSHGQTCSRCVEGSFSMDVNNPNGCTDCFCFGRSELCDDAKYVWAERLLPNLTITFSRSAGIMVKRQENGFYVLPDNVSQTKVPIGIAESPIYWSLPNVAGDQTLSYSGHLSFIVENRTNAMVSDLERLLPEPLVVLIGHGLPILYRSEVRWVPGKILKFNVQLHEDFWHTQDNGKVNRSLMMVILQNITNVLVRTTWDSSAIYTKITDVKLEYAIDSTQQLGRSAQAIEMCVCPKKYSGLSCQDPAVGYYQVPNVGPLNFTDLTGVIGQVERCVCNGHSNICNPNTGKCIDCMHNTTGDHCQLCAAGYYGEPSNGSSMDCQLCACPLLVISNSFSQSCIMVDNNFICTGCQKGYAGTRCEYCTDGYYGNPTMPGDTCKPCDCNPEGSVSKKCDPLGICECLQGITGEKCDQCQPRYAVVHGECVSCDVGCTMELMKAIDDLDISISLLPFNLSNTNLSASLTKLDTVSNETNILTDLLKNLRYAEVNDLLNKHIQLATQVDHTLEMSTAMLEKSRHNNNDTEKLLAHAKETDDKVHLMNIDIEKFINGLVETVAASFHNRSGVNVTQSLEMAKKILQEIQARNFNNQLQISNREHDLAEGLSNRVKFHYWHALNSSNVQNNTLKDVLDNLLFLIQHCVKLAEDVLNNSTALNDTIERIKQYLNESQTLINNMQWHKDDMQQLIDDAHVALNRTKENIAILETRATTLDDAIDFLSDKNDQLNKVLHLQTRVNNALLHADNLTNYATDLEKIIESTKLAAADPLKAAHVYENIVKAVEEAKQEANKAMENVKHATNKTNFDELNKSVKEAFVRSQDILDHVNSTVKDNINDLLKTLLNVNKKVDTVNKSIAETTMIHEKIKKELNELPRDTINNLADINLSVDDTNKQTKGVLNQTTEMITEMDQEVKKIFELQNIVGNDLKDINDKVQGVKTSLISIKNLTDLLDSKINRSPQLRSSLADKLNKLKQNIREAREEANKMKTALMSRGKCVKKFRSVAQAGTLNTINFAFRTSEPHSSMMMILIQNVNEKEFLAVELRNSRVRFSWNAGGGTAFVDSDEEVLSQDRAIKETDKWYQVKAQRINRLGRLTVHKLSDQPGTSKSNTSPIGFSVMNLNEKTDLYISGVPSNYRLPAELTPNNFSGCLGSVSIDDQLVGLYNFESNTLDECGACLEVPSQSPGANVYSFDGTGYAVTDKKRITNPLLANIYFDFSTYWENASLFFVGNHSTGEFMSLELQNGYVVFHFYLGNGLHGKLQTDFKYNRNKWVSVSAARNGRFALLDVDSVSKYVQTPEGDSHIEVKNSDLFFGGIPTAVDIDLYRTISGQEIVKDRFLGCMKGLQITTETVNLWDGKATVGVTEGCKDSGLRSIGFYGSGFAEYPGTSMAGDGGELSVSFSTSRSNALLILARNINGDNYYSLALIEGHVEGWFSGGNNPINITSAKTYNDGIVHNIAVKKTNRRIDIFVDDVSIGDNRLPKNFQSIQVREDGGLYLGGLPDGFKVEDLARTVMSLDGCLSDIVINGIVLNINKPKQYDKADIGRCYIKNKITENIINSPVNDAPMPIRMPESLLAPIKTARKQKNRMVSDVLQTTAGFKACSKSFNVNDIEPSAFTFGEEMISFLQINVTKDEVQRNLEIRFAMRTYYENGLLFYLSSSDHKSFIAGQIQNGFLVVIFDRNGEIKKIVFDAKSNLTDGAWHNVIIVKTHQHITVKLDSYTEKRASITKVLKVDVPLFIGGIPNRFHYFMNRQLVQHSIRGCMKSLVINKNTKTLNDASLVTGIKQCFAKVENGAHFTGASYGVYADATVISQDFSIELDFRTVKADGILFALGHTSDKLAMALQLHEGQMKYRLVTSVDQITMEPPYNSSIGLCDNKWHHVRAVVVGKNVTLQLDDRVQGITGNVSYVTASSPHPVLYLGGKPEPTIHTATLTSKGFEGCLKNVVIHGRAVDWFNLVHSVAIHLSSCPVV